MATEVKRYFDSLKYKRKKGLKMKFSELRRSKYQEYVDELKKDTFVTPKIETLSQLVRLATYDIEELSSCFGTNVDTVRTREEVE